MEYSQNIFHTLFKTCEILKKVIIVLFIYLILTNKIFMTGYLAYSYSTGLTKKEQAEIDSKTKKS